jgi:hypothetical protein
MSGNRWAPDHQESDAARAARRAREAAEHAAWDIQRAAEHAAWRERHDRTLLAAARHAVADGFPVHPLGHNRLPLWKDWPRWATADPALPDSDDPRNLGLGWWSPRCCCVGAMTGNGRVVLDIDVKHGPNLWHDEHAARLEGTRRHRSASGGFHYLFQSDDDIHGSASRIAPQVDVRGWHNFVVWPGSPGYTIDRDLPIRELGDYPWLSELMLQHSGPPVWRRGAMAPAVVETAAAIEDPWIAAVARDYADVGFIPIDLAPLALAKIEQALQRVSDAAKGARNDVLFRQAIFCGGLLHYLPALTVDTLVELLCDALTGPRLNRRKDRECAMRGIRLGQEEPIDLLADTTHVRALYRHAHRMREMGVGLSQCQSVLRMLDADHPEPLGPRVTDEIGRRCCG